MSHFVVIFDRLRPGSPTVERYDDAESARVRLFEIELNQAGDPDHGVVLLYAESEDSLRRTHGSLFSNLDELLETAQS
jgi:hypothetical protein